MLLVVLVPSVPGVAGRQFHTVELRLDIQRLQETAPPHAGVESL